MKRLLMIIGIFVLLTGCETTDTITADTFVEENSNYNEDPLLKLENFFNAYKVEVDGYNKLLLENRNIDPYHVTFTCGDELISANSNEVYQFLDLSTCGANRLELTITSNEQEYTEYMSMLEYLYTDEELDEMYQYEDYDHLASYDDITAKEGSYIVYFYSNACHACATVKYEVMHFYKDVDDVYFLEAHSVSGSANDVELQNLDGEVVELFGTPTLLIMEDGKVVDYILGSYAILDYLDGIE